MALIPPSDIASTVTDQLGNPDQLLPILDKASITGAFRNAGNKFTGAIFDQQTTQIDQTITDLTSFRTAALNAGATSSDVADIDNKILELETKKNEINTTEVDHPLPDSESNRTSPFGSPSGTGTKPIKGLKGYSEHVEKKAPQIMSLSSSASKVEQTKGTTSNPCEFLNFSLGSLLGGLDDLMDDITQGLSDAVNAVANALADGLAAITDFINGVISSITDVINDFVNAVVGAIDAAIGKIGELIDAVADEIGSLLGQINILDDLNVAFNLPNLFGDPCAALAFAQMDSPEAQALQDTLKAQQDAGGTAGGSTPDVGTPGVL
jgi:hypothetical protein